MSPPTESAAMTLFERDHSFFERAGEHDTLLVLFNYLDQPLEARSHRRFMDGLACNRLFLHSGRNDWFQNGIPGIANSFEALIDFCRILPERFGSSRVLYLGHSMGAFGALGCGLGAGAERILASVPEIDLLRPGSVSATRLVSEDLRFPSVRPLLEANGHIPVHVVAGRNWPADMEAVRSIETRPNVTVSLLDCKHETFPYLRDQGRLTPMIRAFVEGEDVGAVLDGL